ncbi:MAG: CCA tRNA nucleotidyltransferase [Desulfamplus sp.]|nr:CCA tRNA nucleotidyltransferase [Desulfamplus sp.]
MSKPDKKSTTLFHEKSKSLYIARTLTQKGFKALFAGGAVRDMIMGKDPCDFDIVTNAQYEEILRIFANEKIKKVGKTFAVCMVNGIEVASCRSDSSHASNSSHASKTDFSFPECDLAKRDITINSMAFDPISDTFIDPFGGKQDLKDRIIRFTGNPEERIAEDPLRMVRACRFVSLLQGILAPSTLESIIRHRNMIVDGTAPERIRHEILKAMSHATPSLFFRTLNTAGLLELIFPSLSRCDRLDGGPHHGETVLEHCLMSGDALSPRKPVLRLAGYLHDAGKYDAAQIKDGQLTFPDHEKMADAVIHDLQKLRFSSEEIKFIDAVIKTHMRPLKADSTPKAVRRLLAFLKKHDIKWQTFMQMRIADKASNLAKQPYNRSDIRLRIDKIRQELKNDKLKGGNVVLSVRDLEISGHDIMKILNISPCPEVGKIMNHLLECVIDEPSLNNIEALKELVVQFGLLQTPSQS